jgi:Xaa-Pro aminopeptidase
MSQRNVASLLVLSPENRRYFSGFKAQDSTLTESSGALFIDHGRQALLTDSRYTLAAAKEAPLFEIVACRRGLGSGLRELAPSPSSPIHYEPDYVTVSVLRHLEESLAREKVAFSPSPFNPSRPRIVKSPLETRLIQKAVNITEKALALLWDELEPGVPEEWAAQFLESKFRELGGDGVAFPSIVAVGANAALPHAEPGKKKIGKSEMVIVDCGARYRGYCSDMTRTYVPAKPLGWQKEIYKIVRDAQLLAMEEIKAGVAGSLVDKAARDYIAKYGYGDYFQHSLGHGVGLQIHEEPRLSPNAIHEPLLAGSLVTVEPGIYLPGKGGVRLEDLVLITEKGFANLNSAINFYYF